MPDELLVILASAAPSAAEALAGRATVLQQAGARVLIVTGAEAAALRDLPEVAGVYDGPPQGTAAEDLTEEERLFADAWALRQTQTKSRKGEGRDWDGEGFEGP